MRAQTEAPTLAELMTLARAEGLVGEMPDGRIGIVFEDAATARLRGLVRTINQRRMTLYATMAGRHAAAYERVAACMSCTLVTRVAPGGYYQHEGAWRQRAAGEPAAMSDFCQANGWPALAAAPLDLTRACAQAEP